MQSEFQPEACSDKFDGLVYIGRFQPFHNGHLATVVRALSLAKQVIVLVGSANRSRSAKNPWSFEERRAMIHASVPEPERVVVLPLADVMYDTEAWAGNVKAAALSVLPERAKIGLIGHYKDESSWYLNCFPEWTLVEQPNYEGLNSTDIRRNLFEADSKPVGALPVPSETLAWLVRWQNSNPEVCRWVQDEAKAVADYRRSWACAPYPPTFVTVDGVVTHRDHLLVIRRGGFPGKGLLALPGGFLDPGERLQDAVVRELAEETNLEVSVEELQAAIRASQVFDHPDRSSRGRTVTHAYRVDLGCEARPRVTPGDDARDAFWMPIAEFLASPTEVYEDHWFIVSRLCA